MDMPSRRYQSSSGALMTVIVPRIYLFAVEHDFCD